MKDNEPQVIFATGASLRDTVAADPGDVRVGIPHSHKPGGTSGSSGGRKGVERRRFRCMFYVISFIILLVIVAAVVLLALQASRGSTQFVLKGIGAGRVAHDNVTGTLLSTRPRPAHREAGTRTAYHSAEEYPSP